MRARLAAASARGRFAAALLAAAVLLFFAVYRNLLFFAANHDFAASRALGPAVLAAPANGAFAAASTPVDVVAIVVKDEADVLPLWLSWHAAIFGVENVVIVDQESSDPRALQLLTAFERAGGTVVWRVKEFRLKGEHTVAALRVMQRKKAVRLFFPLDVDEFIIAAPEGSDGGDARSYLRSAADVRAAIASLVADEARAFLPTAKFSYADFYASSFLSDANDSIETVSLFSKGHMGAAMKKFFRAETLLTLDHGNHDGTTTSAMP
jgi:hypothetical protein